MVVFNISALAQAIILALIFGFFYLIGFDSFFEGSFIWQMYCIHFFVALTYRAGLKGKLFWIIPTWFITICFLIMANANFHNETILEDEVMNPVLFQILKIFNYVFPVFLALRMIFKLDSDFVREFRNAHLILQNMNKTEDYFNSNRKEFWAQITHTFVHPSRFYLFAYSVHKLIFRNSVKQEEFVNHFLMLINLIKERLAVQSNANELLRFEEHLNHFTKTGGYSHDINSLKKLAEVIDLEVKTVS